MVLGSLYDNPTPPPPPRYTKQSCRYTKGLVGTFGLYTPPPPCKSSSDAPVYKYKVNQSYSLVISKIISGLSSSDRDMGIQTKIYTLKWIIQICTKFYYWISKITCHSSKSRHMLFYRKTSPSNINHFCI